MLIPRPAAPAPLTQEVREPHEVVEDREGQSPAPNPRIANPVPPAPGPKLTCIPWLSSLIPHAPSSHTRCLQAFVQPLPVRKSLPYPHLAASSYFCQVSPQASPAPESFPDLTSFSWAPPAPIMAQLITPHHNHPVTSGPTTRLCSRRRQAAVLLLPGPSPLRACLAQCWACDEHSLPEPLSGVLLTTLLSPKPPQSPFQTNFRIRPHRSPQDPSALWPPDA